ncbi:MAG: hypothetical protein MK066_14875 [Crocinitomicaceae bacterium]|nr:hypothetical protein [Crocinitomicaceae bacterium]
MRLANPAFYFDKGIITSHYWGHGGGYGAKYHVHEGQLDTLEWIDIDIFDYYGGIDSVVYQIVKYPMMDTVRTIDTMVYLPPEYQYERLIKN